MKLAVRIRNIDRIIIKRCKEKQKDKFNAKNVQFHLSLIEKRQLKMAFSEIKEF